MDAWRLTPRELALLQERHDQRMQREELFVGLIAATVLNPHRGKRKPLTPADFFPRLRHQRRSPEQMFEALAKALNAKPEK